MRFPVVPLRRAALCLLLAAACGGGGGGPPRPTPRDETQSAGPLETYQQLGFIAGPGYFPAVLGFSTLAGPGDSTYVLIGLSMPNAALRFQRDPAGFVAEYRVSVSFATPDSLHVRRVERNESVRIPTFQETGRTDESILFQHLIALEPGRWLVTVHAGDANSSRGFRAHDTLDVPDFRPGGLRLAPPLLVYDGRGRTHPDSVPDLILNPRHTTAYGGEPANVYLEAYDAPEPQPVLLEVLDEMGAIVWSDEVLLEEGTPELRRTFLELPVASLSLGKLHLRVSAEAAPEPARAPLVISISDQWMVANFDEVLTFLEYIATPDEIEALRTGPATDRRRLWEEFWKRRDPIPATPVNEFRDAFFQRVRYATEQFSESGGQPGWRTDRGEVWIVLGQPSYTRERFIGRADYLGRANAWEWEYEDTPDGRLVLIFQDMTGFGRYELTAASAVAFRKVAEKMKSRVAASGS